MISLPYHVTGYSNVDDVTVTTIIYGHKEFPSYYAQKNINDLFDELDDVSGDEFPRFARKHSLIQFRVGLEFLFEMLFALCLEYLSRALILNFWSSGFT